MFVWLDCVHNRTGNEGAIDVARTMIEIHSSCNGRGFATTTVSQTHVKLARLVDSDCKPDRTVCAVSTV